MARQRVADIIAAILVEQGISDVFMLTGGGAMHLNDGFGRASGLRLLFNHHEQACAIAAESYFRASGRLAALNVTTGPGAVNALNGVFGAYVDSIGMVVISGQVKRETIAGNFSIPLRQLGDQEVDIVSMVRGITKYATSLDEPKDVRRVVEKAIWFARRGRAGPVWIDVPSDVQGALVETGSLACFDPSTELDDDDVAPNTSMEEGSLVGNELKQTLGLVFAELAAAKRPVVMVGSGVRLSGTRAAFLELVDRLGVPVVTGWNAHDALPSADPHYVGRPGTVGDRGGNFAVQNADYVVVLGCRLNIRQISYNWSAWAKNARVTMIDIDRAELEKPTLSLHRAIHADLWDVFACAAGLDWTKRSAHADYLRWCRERAAAYPVVDPAYRTKSTPVNPYVFGEALFEALEEGDIVVSGDGTACVTMFQCALIKRGQQLYTNSGCASMGYDLPAAIGAYFATGAKRVICIAGDGSIMMNIQELQTIVGNQLPIKIFVLNNDGYHSIRQTQQNYFSDNIVGCGPDSGLSFPDFQCLAGGFKIAASRIETHDGLDGGIAAALEGVTPHLCEIILDKEQQFAPKLASRRLEDGTMVSPSLEDMAPFLSREELAGNMIMSS